MPSNVLPQSENLQPVKDAARGRVIGGNATVQQIELIDQAVLHLRRGRPKLKRGHFVVESAEEKARTILKKRRDSEQRAS